MDNAQSFAAAGALAGIKVIDLTRVLAGPYCTQMLADHGAEVIKIEPPHGDEARAWGPPFRESDGSASYWVNVNRNKRGVALDLSKPEGREILLRLLGTADVLIDNFKTGTMARWGLGYEEVLASRFPRLIYCRISGFGADGPLGGLPGYDGAVQALAGLMSINGTPSSGPVRVGVPIVDMAVGMMSTIGILMALHERSKSGKGQMLDATLFDTALAILHPHIANFLESGKPPVRTGNVHPNVGPYDLFQTKTRPIYIACGNDRQFAALCAELGREDLAANTMYHTNGDRIRNSAALKVELEAALAGLDGVEFAGNLLEKGIPCGPVLEVPDLVTHAHTAHRKMIVGNPEAPTKMPDGGYRATANPVKLSRTPASVRSSPPQFGESTREVLAELGYSAAEIDTLIASGVAFTGLPVKTPK